MTSERALARVAEQKQAVSMLFSTAKKMKPSDVMLPIPDVDRGRATIGRCVEGGGVQIVVT